MKIVVFISANTSDADGKTAKHYCKATQTHNKESEGPDNHYELLILNHDRAYSESEFRRKYVCDKEMKNSITREGMLIYCRNFVSVSC